MRSNIAPPPLSPNPTKQRKSIAIDANMRNRSACSWWQSLLPLVDEALLQAVQPVGLVMPCPASHHWLPPGETGI